MTHTGRLTYFMRPDMRLYDFAGALPGMAEAQMNFANEDLMSLEIDLSTLDEQRRVSDFLDEATSRIDMLSCSREAQANCLDQLWVSKLADMANSLIDEHGLMPLRRIVRSVEQGWSPQCEEVEAEPTEWAVLRTSAVSSGTFDALAHKRLPSDMEVNTRYQIRDGDILMTRGSGSPAHVGVATVAQTDGRKLLLSDLLYRVRLQDGWSPEYVTLLLGSYPVRGLMSLLLRGQSGQTIKLRADDVKSISIPAPTLEHQERIAHELADFRREILNAKRAVQRSLSVLAERRQALVAAAITGQIDVTTARSGTMIGGVSV